MQNDKTWKGLVPGIYRRMYPVFRCRRVKRFLHTLSPRDGDKLIDLGGEPAFWQYVDRELDVHCVNLEYPDFNDRDSRAALRCSIGDCCDLAGEADDSYDIVFSNSVIEHVGDLERQAAFARTAIRLGSRLWIQTPARIFPVEPHWFALFIHWFPKRFQYRLFWFALRHRLAGVRLTKEEIRQQVDDVRLLTKGELKKMFPGCRIITERFLLWPKSYIVVRSN
jgi:SAM-dependent methyltransferase